MPETQVFSLSREDPLEQGMATHSSILAWEILGQRKLVGYSPWGCKESDTTEQLTHRLIFPQIYFPGRSDWVPLFFSREKLRIGFL